MTNFVLGGPPQLDQPKGKAALNEIIQRVVMCAVHGLPSVATFKRNASGIYVWQKTEPHLAGQSAGGAGEIHADEIPMSKMRWAGFECAWCDARTGWPEIIHCYKCDELVCSGRTEGTDFKCYDDCGAEGVLNGSIEKVKVTDGISGNLDGTGRRQIGYSGGAALK
ncbi:MAG: hypothetical protein AAF583_02690 [Pseudomonadota bacterium]